MNFGLVLAVVCLCSIDGQLNDSVVRQTRSLLSTFDEILIDGAFDVFLSQVINTSSTPTVEVETSVDVQAGVIVDIVDSHILSIYIKGPMDMQNNVYLYIRFVSPLRRYTIQGTGNTITDDQGIINEGTEKFVIDNRGTTNLAIRLNVSDFEVHFTGTGNSRFSGQVRRQTTFDAQGVGDIQALDLISHQVKVISTGVCIVRVMAIEDIHIEVTGISHVYYRLTQGKTPTRTISTGLGQIARLA